MPPAPVRESPALASSAYRGAPISSGPPVLVVHAWWGLNAFVRSFCNRLARAGFSVLAPDLYNGRCAATIASARQLRGTLKRETITTLLRQSAAQLMETSRSAHCIGVVGFSLGAYWAMWLGEQADVPVGATVAFYGLRPGSTAHTSSAFQFHLAEMDEFVRPAAVRRLRKTLSALDTDVEIHTYPGTQHWFFERDRLEAFDAAASRRAWSRTVRFLRTHLG